MARQEEVLSRAGTASNNGTHVLRRMFQMREMGVLLALIVLILLITTQTPYFFTAQNIFNVLRGMSTVGIMAIGMTMIIVTAGIDLSVGSVLAASSMLTARLMFTGVLSPWVAVLAGLTFGTILGMISGLIITKVGVNPFITTLGMLSIGRGITLFLASNIEGTVASNIPFRDEAVNFLGGGYIEPVPIVNRIPFPVIEMFMLVILFSLFMRYTVLGRQIYAVGSNETAARLSGVPVDMVKIFVYTITGALCALAGIMTAGLLSTSAANAGQGVELDVIAAVVIGGASLMGGEGTIFGAIIGAAIMAVLRNAFVLLHFPSYMQTITIGVVIIVAVAVDRLRRQNVSVWRLLREDLLNIGVDRSAQRAIYTAANAVSLGCALLLLVAFLFLPWMTPGEASYTGLNMLVDAPEGIPLGFSLLILMPVCAIIGAGAALWGLLDRRHFHIASRVAAIGGLVGLVYFLIVFLERLLIQNSPDFPDLTRLMGLGFWAALAAALGLVLQTMLPRVQQRLGR